MQLRVRKTTSSASPKKKSKAGKGEYLEVHAWVGMSGLLSPPIWGKIADALLITHLELPMNLQISFFCSSPRREPSFVCIACCRRTHKNLGKPWGLEGSLFWKMPFTVHCRLQGGVSQDQVLQAKGDCDPSQRGAFAAAQRTQTGTDMTSCAWGHLVLSSSDSRGSLQVWIRRSRIGDMRITFWLFWPCIDSLDKWVALKLLLLFLRHNVNTSNMSARLCALFLRSSCSLDNATHFSCNPPEH